MAAKYKLNKTRISAWILAAATASLFLLPAPGQAAGTDCNMPGLVSPQASQKAANMTVGMISDRVSSSASSGTETATTTPQTNVAATGCGTVVVVPGLTESDTTGGQTTKTRNSVWSSLSVPRAVSWTLICVTQP